MKGVVVFVGLVLTITACGRSAPLNPELALKSITSENLARDVNELASDKYEGRQPGTAAENLTVGYIERRFREIGAVAGNPDGSYIQRVPLVGVTSVPTASVTIHGRRTRLRNPEDFVARSVARQDRVTVDSELVFAGYGIEAPEYAWNDYRNVDVKGKIVVLLLGEPARQAADDPTRSDPNFFRGIEQSYYATTRSKRDEAAARGASGVLFILGPEINYRAVSTSFQHETLDIDQPDAAVLRVEAAMPFDRIGDILDTDGENLDELVHRAREPGFRAVPLGIGVSFDISLHHRPFQSRNVVAKFVGADTRVNDEFIVFTAHWDGFGRDPTLQGDQIRNGAIDNALGVAQMLAIAAAFTKLPIPPRRSILLIATTAEEAGLLGARYYVQNPLYPLDRTAASINIDNSFPFGPTSDVINFGAGRSELDEVLRDAAASQNRTVTADPFPTEGFYFRLDQFEFANVGIPALSPATGNDVIGKPGYAKERIEEYLQRDYHQVTDEVRPDWDYGAAVQDAQLDFLIGLRVAEAERWPQWKAGAEFRPHRELIAPDSSR